MLKLRIVLTYSIPSSFLGRKVAMADPDMGRWTYAYDDVENLIAQTDARGVTIAFSYDRLNRLTQKASLLPSASSLQPPSAIGTMIPPRRLQKGS